MQQFTTDQKIDMIFSWMLKSGLALEGLQSNVQVLKVTAKDDWIDEPVAASMLNYKPRTLRSKVKCTDNQLPIDWRVNPSGRGFQYSLKDILNHKDKTSTKI